MISYKDMIWCGSNTKNHTCGCEFTDKDKKDAERWWGGPGAPVAFMNFCDDDKPKTTPGDLCSEK